MKLIRFALFVPGLLIAAFATENFAPNPRFQYVHEGIIRGDTTEKALALVFTGDEFADGGESIRQTLARHQIHGAFFLTGKFYRNPAFREIIQNLKADGHYLGAHSDQHLLYCAWEKRDSSLVSRAEFLADLENNYQAMAQFGIQTADAPFFLPAFEWYNSETSRWCREFGATLINLSPGTRSHTDWTVPEMGERYWPSTRIFASVLDYESRQGLNGFILLTHIGTHPDRTDKFYLQLDRLIQFLKEKGYRFERIDQLLK